MKKLFLFILIGSFSYKTVAVPNSAACSVTIASNPANGLICIGSCATLTAIGNGTPPFHYHWMPGGQTTDTITVCPFAITTYTITVTDSNNCTSDSSITVMTEATPI